MKKLLTILGAVVLLFGLTAGAQADMVTLTFDEIEAWNDTPEGTGPNTHDWLGEEFASMGIHFLPNMNTGSVGTNTNDGVVYDTGMFPVTVDGTQFAGVASVHPDTGTGNAGLVIEFDYYQDAVSLQLMATTVTGGMWWAFDTAIGTGPGQDVGSSFYMTGPGVVTVTMNPTAQFDYILFATSLGGSQTAAIDNITFDGSEYAVPIPASLLLLGTGLLPLLRLRRRS